ncbi:HypC/HybG/HupF family hydrogenase formation chaperone [Candidatus Woesearchaeota archaeon]|nr:HypC/HybG/HupF family hydrogenase formation chaperone [Candidatus Woesearchaeota archaeon]
MCLSIPGRIEKTDGETAVVGYGNERRTVSTKLVPCAPGEWVVVSGGFVMQKLSEEDAKKALALWDEADERERRSCC